MVKHQKEKQYQSAREHRLNSQLRSGTAAIGSTYTRRLPFHCCALTLLPFENPVCTKHGIIFENAAIMNHLLQHKSDPVTGENLTSRDLITLHMSKDDENKWQCPIINKPFTDFTKIVAIKTSPNEANVYSYEAVHEMNIKPRCFEDLLSGKKFKKDTDMIVLQDPNDDAHSKLRDLQNFDHIQKNRKDNKEAGRGGDVRHSVTASRIMQKLDQKKKQKEEERKKRKSDDGEDAPEKKKLKIFSDDVSGVKMTTGKCSASLTSTVMTISNENEGREATQDEILNSTFQALKRMKKKGYARLHTNLGVIDVELHCDIAPRTTANFIGLMNQNYYDDSVFHRSIRNFMIQGGKPAPPRKEESLWGPTPFVDEFDDRLTHSERGILSMANKGPTTNLSQFFITFKSCTHLDRKHSVFGRVLPDSMPILKELEDIPTDKRDRPKKEIKIITAEVLVDPIREAEEAEMLRIEKKARERQRVHEERKTSALGGRKTSSEIAASLEKTQTQQPLDSIGKYLPKNALNSFLDDTGSSTITKSKKTQEEEAKIPVISQKLPVKKKTAAATFGNFSSW